MVRSFPFKENLLLIVSAHCHHVADSFQSWFTGSDWDVVIATHQWANLLKRSEVNCFIGTKGVLHCQGRYIFVRLNRIFCEPSLADAPRLGLTWWEVKHLSQQLHIFIFFGGVDHIQSTVPNALWQPSDHQTCQTCLPPVLPLAAYSWSTEVSSLIWSCVSVRGGTDVAVVLIPPSFHYQIRVCWC